MNHSKSNIYPFLLLAAAYAFAFPATGENTEMPLFPPTSSVHNLDGRLGLSNDYMQYKTEAEYLNSLLKNTNGNAHYKLVLYSKRAQDSIILYAAAFNKDYKQPDDFIVAIISYICDEKDNRHFKDIVRIPRNQFLSYEEICTE